MADEAAEAGGGGGVGGDEVPPPPVKCPECVPGLPAWMATFSDLVTLLLTFFVLLLSFAKTESAKYEAALGSIRNAFGGNVMKHGEVIQRGKSPDDSPSMMDSQEPIRPFPIEFLTTEGFLDKHEINRESSESLNIMKRDLKTHALTENVDVYEMPEGIKVNIKDKIYFEKGSLKPSKVSAEVFKKVINLLTNEDWTIFVIGHASIGERSKDRTKDAFELSAARASAVTKYLIKSGVRAKRISTVFRGDSKPIEIPNQTQALNDKRSRRVEFILRKTDLNTGGNKVDPN